MTKHSYPKISLVTVCYNHKDYIAETIESVLSQNYPNLQYVVVDDGSTDGSWEVIQKYKDELYHCERLEGYRDTPTVALNYGFKKTNGEIMGWLNSDDILLPNSLFTLANIFNDNSKVDWVTGMATTINYKSEIVNSYLRSKNKYDYLLGNWQVIQQESTFWRRCLWNKAGGKLEGELKWAFDTELWTRFFFLAEHYHVNTPLGAFRKSQKSKSTSDIKSFLDPSNEYLKRMKKRASSMEKLLVVVYFILTRLLWFLFILMPIILFAKLPLVNKFMYKVIKYSFEEDRWKVSPVSFFKIFFS